ncbi:BTB/POZ domain-containing protein 3-like [Bradysia coprophila]|uniref:BTB/POZ domain-containing protein 3-like n=1 Tax=Bradysia coprophila TaxID=38358 RepID=UPI00187DADF6|nr:BTB/POZ domain-containing protein 3-like [Bradysia coprophila]
MNVPNNDADAIPLEIEPRMEWFVNNNRFADVSFIVGEQKEMVYAHKIIIASGSPVFEQMFFANHNLQMTGSKPIEIPDLTATGFINMLKYIYTNVLKELDLSELFETFMAGDKYQVYNMNDTILSFIKNALNTSNCCIIYDQLMQFPSDYVCVPLDQVKTLIRYNSVLAFKNRHFVDISEATLVDLLSMDALTINEIDVLKSCALWVAEETERQNSQSNVTNKRKVFEPIKNLIRFSKITFDQLRKFNPIKDLLSNDELSSLLLYLLNITNFTIECHTAREKLELKSAFCKKHSAKDYYPSKQCLSELSVVFKSRGSIFVTHVYTFLPKSVEDLEFSIMLNELNVKLNYEKLLSEDDNCWYFRFIDFVEINMTKTYTFVFNFEITWIPFSSLSRDIAMFVDGTLLKCNLSRLTNNSHHCLKKIDFYQTS